MARKVTTINSALSRTMKPVTSVGDSANMVRRSMTMGDGLENLVAGLGTSRDKRSHTRYTFPRFLTRFDLENMFRGSWLSKRIVTAIPDDMTREWRRFTFADDDENPNIEALEKEEKALNVKEKFKEALYWARLYGGSMIIIGTKDSVDMTVPLVAEKIKKGDIKYMHVLDRWRCSPSGKTDTDLTSPNFGKPLTYMIAESAVEVHWTRVIRFNGQKLPYFAWQSNGQWDDSELQHIYESIVNYDTSTASIASMLFEANIDVVSSEGLTDLLGTKEGEAKVIKRFQLGQMMKSFNRTLVLDAKEKYEKKQNSFASIDKIWGQFMVDVSGASHIAMSVLFGQQSGGLDSGGDDDLRNYYDHCAGEQSSKVDGPLNQFDQIFVRHTLGTMPDDYKSEWNPLWQIDSADQATIDYQNAQRDQIYLTAGVVTEGLIASELKLRGTYRSMSDEDVQLAQELAKEMDEFQSEQRDNLLNPPEPSEEDDKAQQTNNPATKTGAKKKTKVVPKRGK